MKLGTIYIHDTNDTHGMWNEIEFEMLNEPQMEWDSKWNGTQSAMGLKVEWDLKWNGTQSGMGLKAIPVQEYETSSVEWSKIDSSV